MNSPYSHTDAPIIYLYLLESHIKVIPLGLPLFVTRQTFGRPLWTTEVSDFNPNTPVIIASCVRPIAFVHRGTAVLRLTPFSFAQLFVFGFFFFFKALHYPEFGFS